MSVLVVSNNTSTYKYTFSTFLLFLYVVDYLIKQVMDQYNMIIVYSECVINAIFLYLVHKSDHIFIENRTIILKIISSIF